MLSPVSRLQETADRAGRSWHEAGDKHVAHPQGESLVVGEVLGWAVESLLSLGVGLIGATLGRPDVED